MQQRGKCLHLCWRGVVRVHPEIKTGTSTKSFPKNKDPIFQFEKWGLGISNPLRPRILGQHILGARRYIAKLSFFGQEICIKLDLILNYLELNALRLDLVFSILHPFATGIDLPS